MSGYFEVKPWGVLLGILGGILGAGVSPGSPNPDPVSVHVSIVSFSHPFSDLAFIKSLKSHARFQTWHLRNYVIIA